LNAYLKVINALKSILKSKNGLKYSNNNFVTLNIIIITLLLDTYN